MKDFKSQVINTPGVIRRVSELFHGNPNLIEGFNTFLPNGYRIELSAEPNTITVTTPQGKENLRTNRQLPPPTVHPSLPPRDHQTHTAVSVLGNMTGSGPHAREAPVHDAIQFLNKIKHRFCNDEDIHIYKKFLDILQQIYHENQARGPHILQQVQLLFKDAPDLLAEFQDFLPGSGLGPLHPVAPSPTWLSPNAQTNDAANWSGRSAAPKRTKKRPLEKEVTPVTAAPTKPPAVKNKRAKHHHKADNDSLYGDSPAVRSPAMPPPPPPVIIPPYPNGNFPANFLPGQVYPPNGFPPGGNLPNRDKDQRHDSPGPSMYDQFLRLLSLFSKDIISPRALIDQVEVIFADAEDLVADFKDLLLVAAGGELIGPPGSLRMQASEALLSRPADDSGGPSYRKLPQSEIHLACSGRDEHCRSLLNDGWISHPAWASEEYGFQGHKKNSFEDALHKSEEERHEYQVYIEGIRRTIALLDPLAARIEEMSPDERASFQIDALGGDYFGMQDFFGGSARGVYVRTLRKLYGSATAEIIQGLKENPCVAIPVVLARLKSKDEEWRKAQREWSRTWKEVDAKNFYKAIDHQGVNFKQTDKKAITVKSFIGDVETRRKSMIEGRRTHIVEGHAHKQPAFNIPSSAYMFTLGSVGFQIEYLFDDMCVLCDAMRLVYTYLDHTQTQYSAAERKAIEDFLRTFVPVFCGLNAAEFNFACDPLQQYDLASTGPADDVTVNGDGPGTSRPNVGQEAGTSSKSRAADSGVVPSDLRQKLLRAMIERSDSLHERATASHTQSKRSSRKASATARDVALDGMPEVDVWINEPSADSSLQDNIAFTEDDEDRPFFCNTTFYTLLRLLQLLYVRLHESKETGKTLARAHYSSLLANPVAVKLGLDDPNGPPALLQQTAARPEDTNVLYMYLLDACTKVFENELDQPTFEEHMRWFFGHKAYRLFTFDKLIAALVKQVQTVLSDLRCHELWSLLQIAALTIQDIIRYRREAERYVSSDEHLYRIVWSRKAQTLQIQLMGGEDPSVDAINIYARWREYVNSYVTRHRTEWLPSAAAHSSNSFLFHCSCLDRPEHEENDGRVEVHDGMSVRVSLPRYRLMYAAGAEDVLVRRRPRQEEQMLQVRAAARMDERERCRLLV
ncbi:hypothetical protein FISHEDRAFT_39019 [Fistulina hepatica ATCC 64428]|uniref:Histone deacetylase interacting domain-containing protein n=1 Tax=Fistulina hepatica ATCC 64428 TaxID=1128425 RepID=A0A0D7AIF0_9AGAR|nr:hypothetical protein FISHEDRAFT_39019 [Fistulina hepatica ATCC 64428]